MGEIRTFVVGKTELRMELIFHKIIFIFGVDFNIWFGKIRTFVAGKTELRLELIFHKIIFIFGVNFNGFDSSS